MLEAYVRAAFPRIFTVCVCVVNVMMVGAVRCVGTVGDEGELELLAVCSRFLKEENREGRGKVSCRRGEGRAWVRLQRWSWE